MSGGTNGGRMNGAPPEERTTGYLSLVNIINVRSMASLAWKVEPSPGWNVVLGDNGSGKSTFLRAVAYLMLPGDERSALRLNVYDWARGGQEAEGEVHVFTRIEKEGLKLENKSPVWIPTSG